MGKQCLVCQDRCSDALHDNQKVELVVGSLYL